MSSRILNQNAKALAELLSADEIATLLEQTRKRKQEEAEATKNRERQVAVERIADLLTTATNALQEAGELADRYGIPFTFVTPKGKTEVHPGWQGSACYPSDGWFYNDSYYRREPNKVDNQPVGVDDDSRWQSSSYNC